MKIEKGIDPRIKQIADNYGAYNQKIQAVEECAELIQAIAKLNRASSNEEWDGAEKDIIGEIADVEIMIKQLKYLMQLKESDIEQEIDKKLNRQIKRIEDEKNEI